MYKLDLEKSKEPEIKLPTSANLYAGQKATVRARHVTVDWFKIGKEYIWLYSVTLFVYLLCRVHHRKCQSG